MAGQLRGTRTLLMQSKGNNGSGIPGGGSSASTTTAVAPKGHFAVYTREGRRFVVPIEYLKTDVFVELFRLSEEEFGLPTGDRRITLPCDAAFMERVIASLKRLTKKATCAAAPFFT